MAKKDDVTRKLSDKTEFFAVDFFRVVFALGVVAIHLGPLEDVKYTPLFPDECAGATGCSVLFSGFRFFPAEKTG